MSAGVRASSAESLAESSELAAIAKTKTKTRTKTKTNRKPARIGRAITLVLFLRLLSQAAFSGCPLLLSQLVDQLEHFIGGLHDA